MRLEREQERRPQILGHKAVIFDAAGVSVREWWAGGGSKLQTAAVGFVVLYVAVVLADLLLFAFASSSTDPLLRFHNVLEVGLENAPMMGIWLCAAVNFGISLSHLNPLRSVDQTEAMLEKRAQQKQVVPL